MLYPKNVPNYERVLRIIGGIVLVAAGLALSGQSWLLTGGALASAAFMVVTGFVGWCPACAMVGRKIKSNQPKS